MKIYIPFIKTVNNVIKTNVLDWTHPAVHIGPVAKISQPPRYVIGKINGANYSKN